MSRLDPTENRGGQCHGERTSGQRHSVTFYKDGCSFITDCILHCNDPSSEESLKKKTKKEKEKNIL